MRHNVSDFGKLVRHYEKARRPYPKETLNFLKANLPPNPTILDLGCGSGISTRQLVKIGRVVGCDPDPIMLRTARKNRTNQKERYVQASSQHLPFRDDGFDAVTAFAAFHWFADRKSISEIRRVLKPGGAFFVVNKMGVKSWSEGYRKTIIRAIGREVARFRKGIVYKPVNILKEGGFRKVRVRNWKKSESYDLRGALDYVQSVSIWNSVPVNLRPRALQELKQYFQKVKKRNGDIERKLTVKAVVGLK